VPDFNPSELCLNFWKIFARQGQGLRAKAAKKFKATTGSNHGQPAAPNLLNQDFSADAPNQKWVCDIT
jgi:putative transposase